MAKASDSVLDELYGVIESRRGGDPEVSYVAKKFTKGTPHIAKKVGEEACELAIAAVQGDPKQVIHESADLLFHMMMLWVDRGIRPKDVFDKLRERRGVSGIEEKRSRLTIS